MTEPAPESRVSQSELRKLAAESLTPSVISLPRPAILAGLWQHHMMRASSRALTPEMRYWHLSQAGHVRARAQADARVSWSFDLLTRQRARFRRPFNLRKKQ